MRTLLGVLHAGRARPSYAPQPTLHELEALIERARGAGLPVDADRRGRAARAARRARPRGLPRRAGGAHQRRSSTRAARRRRCACATVPTPWRSTSPTGATGRHDARSPAAATASRACASASGCTAASCRPGGAAAAASRSVRAPARGRGGGRADRGARGVSVVRVLIADDQALVRAGFRMILDAEDDLDVVGEAADGAEAVELARRLKPDVVLMDIRMPRARRHRGDAARASRSTATRPCASSCSRRSTSTSTSTRRCAPARAASCSRTCRPSSSRRHPRRRRRRGAARAVDHQAADPGVRGRRARRRAAAEGPRRADRARARGLRAHRARALQRGDRGGADRERDDGQDARRAAC